MRKSQVETTGQGRVCVRVCVCVSVCVCVGTGAWLGAVVVGGARYSTSCLIADGSSSTDQKPINRQRLKDMTDVT